MSYTLDSAYGGNICLSKAGVAAGTTTTVTTANATTYAIGGRLYSKAATSNESAPTTDINTGKTFVPVPAGKSCLFLLGRNAAGGLVVAQGPFANTGDIGANGVNALDWPQMDGAYTPFGYLAFSAAANLAAPWTFGASNTSGVTGATYVWQDIALRPAVPV